MSEPVIPEPVMPEPVETIATTTPARGAVLRGLFGSVRLAYLPVLVTYFCYGASGITSIALLYFQKDTLGITPAEAAAIAFWVALPWSTKMVAGVASDVHPIFGRRRISYLLLGALLAFAGYGWLATERLDQGHLPGRDGAHRGGLHGAGRGGRRAERGGRPHRGGGEADPDPRPHGAARGHDQRGLPERLARGRARPAPRLRDRRCCSPRW